MTVDSEAIFASMELRRHAPRALAELRGAMAAAWLDEREPATLFLARGVARPLWIGRTRTELFFASTRRALAIVEAALRVRLKLTRGPRRTAASTLSDGQIVRERRFRPDRSYREDGYLPPVRAPHEARLMPRRLAVLRRRQPDLVRVDAAERVEQTAARASARRPRDLCLAALERRSASSRATQAAS